MIAGGDEQGSRIPERADVAFERRARRRHRVAAVTVVAFPAFAFTIPFLGTLLSFATPFVAGSRGADVWPSRRWKIVLASIVTLAALWVTLVVAASAVGHPDPVMYLAVPLCAPSSSIWLFLPPIVAIVSYGAVAAMSVAMRRAWIWPIAAVAGGLAYVGVWEFVGRSISWVC
jgi:hypothetical protein